MIEILKHRLYIDDNGQLRNAVRELVFDPSTVESTYKEYADRHACTGAVMADFSSYRGPTITRVTEPDGRVWWNVDDGTRLATVRDIEAVRKELARQKP